MRTLLVLALLLAAPLALAQSVSVPVPDLSHNDSFTYDTTLVPSGGANITATSQVSVAVESVDVGGQAMDAYRVETAHQGSRSGEVSIVWYRTTDFAKLRVEHRSPQGTTVFFLDEPCREWQFPLTSGKTWTTSCAFQGAETFTIASNWSVRGPESVTTPAGTFQAMVLRQEGEGFVDRWWFARETCLFAKHESADADGHVMSMEVLHEFECTPVAGGATTGTPPTTTSPATTSPTGATPRVTTPTVTGGALTSPPVGTPTATSPAGNASGIDTPGPGVALVVAGAAAIALLARRKDS